MSLLFALALASASQTPETTPAFQLPGPLDRPVLFDEPGDGQLWALGADWKASFGPEGVLYVPITGRADVTPRPVRFRLTSATLAGEALDVTAPTRVAHDDDSVELSHGDVRQVWNVTPLEVEQTFVLDTLPSRGDLVLSIDVDTELQRRALGRDLLLENADGSIRYGSAIAIDGNGRTVDVERVATPDGFELRVDAAFVANAELPLVVDPIVSNTFTVAASTRPQRRPDASFGHAVAGSGNESAYRIVWEELAGGLDVDIMSVQIDTQGAVMPNTLKIIDASTFICQRPKVAYDRPEEMFFVVYERSVTDGATWHVSGRRGRLSGTSGYYQQSNLSGVIPGDHRNPDIGGFDGSPSATGNGFTIAWENGTPGSRDILGRVISPLGASLAATVTISTGSGDDRFPDVSRGAGWEFFGLHFHNVVWTRNPSSNSSTVHGRRVATNGVALTAEMDFSAGNYSRGAHTTETLSYPALPDNSLPYFAIFDTEFSGPELMYSRQVGNGFDQGGTNLTFMEGREQPYDALQFAVANVGAGVMYAYTVSEGGSLSLRASTGRLNLRPTNGGHFLGLGERSILVAQNLSGEADFALASRAEGGDFRDEGALFWSSNGIVQGALFDAPGTVISPIMGTQFCNALPNSTGERGWVTGLGTSSVFGSKAILGEDIPAGSFGYLLVAESFGNTLPAGSQGRLCLSGNIGRYLAQVQAATAEGTMGYVVNPQALPQPTGNVAALPGDTWYFQIWHRDSVGGVATSNFTNSLQVAFQ